MKLIGLDFGTTNSIISYVDNDKTESYKMGGVDGVNYIPSYLAVEDDGVEIGVVAKELASMDSEVDIYSRFKILLGETNKKRLEKYGFSQQRSPVWATATYIKKILDIYRRDMRIDHIDKLVVTIPEIWQNDNLQARSRLKEILEGLKLGPFDFASEPGAAGAYFISRFKHKNKKDFEGHFIVFDYGGGTLDVSLIESSGDKIKILERGGIGQSDEYLGKAGVAYDRYVVQKATEKAGLKLQERDEEFYPLMIEFERKKIQMKDQIKKYIIRYQKTRLDKPIFSIQKGRYNLEFTPSILSDSFNELLLENINSTLLELRKKFATHNVNEKDSSRFKIVMVGGFSAFWLTQKAVMDFFGTVTLSDKRFEEVLTAEETALAISRGAALIASEQIEEEVSYPMTVGVIAARKVDKSWELMHIPLLRRGDVAQIDKIVYLDEGFTGVGPIPLYVDDGSKTYKLIIDKKLEELFPNFDVDNNHWKMGIHMDHNSFFYIYIEDKYKKTFTHELGNLMEKYKDTLVLEKHNG